MIAGFYQGLKENIKDNLIRMDSQPTILAGIIEIVIYINNYYYKRKFKKIGGKPLFFGYKKIIPRISYYKSISIKLDSTRKIRYGNIKKELKY